MGSIEDTSIHQYPGIEILGSSYPTFCINSSDSTACYRKSAGTSPLLVTKMDGYSGVHPAPRTAEHCEDSRSSQRKEFGCQRNWAVFNVTDLGESSLSASPKSVAPSWAGR